MLWQPEGRLVQKLAVRSCCDALEVLVKRRFAKRKNPRVRSRDDPDRASHHAGYWSRAKDRLRFPSCECGANKYPRPQNCLSHINGVAIRADPSGTVGQSESLPRATTKVRVILARVPRLTGRNPVFANA